MPGAEMIGFNSAHDTALAPRVLPAPGVRERETRPWEDSVVSIVIGGVCVQKCTQERYLNEAFENNSLIQEG